MGHNNPVLEALEECKDKPGFEQIDCVVSIGTGESESLSLGTLLMLKLKGIPAVVDSSGNGGQLVTALASIVTDTQRSHNEMIRRRTPGYYRFNVDKGLEVVRLDEWKEVKRVAGITQAWLGGASEGNALKACVAALM